MICPGIVTNVTNFGAFVDIGVHQDGLVHVSQLSLKFVKDPREAVSPGDRVSVKVLEVNVEKNQISLSIKQAQEAPKPQARPPRENRRDDREAQPDRTSHRGPKPAPGIKSAAGPKPKTESRPAPKVEKKIFNNAFAGLASLRKDLPK